METDEALRVAQEALTKATAKAEAAQAKLAALKGKQAQETGEQSGTAIPRPVLPALQTAAATSEQLADILTKLLERQKIVELRQKICMIYNECNQEYRLNESGDLHVPCESTNRYCYGPCFSETRRLLDCLEEMVYDFRFNNQATTHIIRKSLDEGCSYSTEKGTFIVGDLSSRKTCDLFSRADHTVRLEYAIGLIVGFCWLVFLQYQ